MRPEEFLLRDILFAAEAISKMASEIDWHGFSKSHLYQSAIKFDLMVIGEAASKVSRDLSERYPDVDWRSLKDFRNVLAHEYFALDLELVWEAAANRTPTLAKRVREILEIEFPDITPDINC